MDRSFLSQANVVKASRNFVCIRLATYEDQAEADFMKSLFVGRSGQLENTTFALLSSDGRRKLTKAGRGPFHAYRGSAGMAAGMNQIAAQHRPRKQVRPANAQLTLMKNLDLALNVAAAEGLPLIITVATQRQGLDRLNEHLVPVAWSDSVAGQFIYASVLDQQELKKISGVDSDDGIFVVEPDQFGLSGKVLAHSSIAVNRDKLKTLLDEVIATFPRANKDHHSHVRLGIQLGIDWESLIPETDPRSIRAKQRARGGR
jgi:hypothetical protein